MNAKEFIAKLSKEKGVDVTVAAVRHHARLGRIGSRIDGRWVFETEDLERMMEYAGKQGPRKGIGIRALVWDEITSKWGAGEVNTRFSCTLLQGVLATVRYIKPDSIWEWEIEGSYSIENGFCNTAEEAKTACEAAWHELLMREVLEGSK